LNYNIPVRLVQLGKHHKDVIIALRKHGIKVAQSEFSRYVNDVENPPKSELVLSEADKIIAEWEKAGELNAT
jgi:hypothetical protein